MQETQILSDGLQSRSFNIPRYRLTKLGEQMARLPIDPKIARILLAAKKHDCMAEILVIASALSIQDPRERPLEARDAAAKAHERFADKQSDFLAYLNIWDSFQRERDKGLSNRQMVAWCHQYFLSHLRMREWRELHAQLAQIVIEMGLTDKESAFRRPEPDKNRAAQMSDTSIRPTSQSADLAARLKQKELAKKHARAERRAAKEASYEQIHRALLTGLIANVGMKSPDGNDYTGARGSRFHLFPASALFKSKPKWVMAAELTETTRLYARDVAAIQPEWIEQEAPHLVKYHYFEPHWEQKRGEVVASERVTLYGLTVLPRRPVAYGRIAPAEAREIFIRSALVAQEMGSFNAPFFVHNQKLIREVAELEHKSRRQDVLVDDEILFEFYNQRLPETVFVAGDGGVYGANELSGSLKAQRQPETPFHAARLAPQGFTARALTAADLDALYALCQSQPDYYRHLGEPLTRDKLTRSLAALPPAARRENKHFIGFWQQGSLKAALEIIFAYPDKETVLLGLLMVDKSAQGAGIGTTIAQKLAAVAAELGYREIILSYAEGNAQSRAFWLKNGYQETGETDEPEQDGEARLIAMSRRLPEAQTPSENKVGWVATQQNAQKQPETVGRILESDKTFDAAQTSDSRIRPTCVSDDLKGSLKPHIRPATTSDATAVAELFRRAVKHISNSHYSEQEKNAWLQGADNADFWQKRIDGGNVRVATHNGRMLGFIEYQPEQSHLNCLFTDPSHQRQGIATALLNAVLPSADSGKTITADVSKAASAFFQKQGFVRQHENQIPRNGLVLTNYRMVRQANHAQKQPETVGRILESDKTFDAAQTSDTSIRPTRLSGSLKPQTPSEKPLADIRTFQAWLKTAERDNPRLLFLSRDDLMQHAAAHITEEQFPKHWQTADGKFKLSYRFEPHHPLDGVTLTLPLTVLNRISPAALEWLVPGMIREKIQLQIKILPKQIRRICVPVPEFITQFLSQNPDRNAPILPQLAQAIAKTAGDIRILEQINQDEWAAFRLPEHCYFNLRIIDDGGQELAMGRDLIQIKQQLGKAAATTFRDNTQEFERDNVTAWDIGTLPESIKFARGKQQLTGYLGLQKEKDGRIALRLFDTSAAAEQAHRLGVIELMKLQLKEQVKDLNKGIQGFTQAAMLLKHINADTLRDDLTQAVCDRAFIGEDELPRNEKAFKEQIKRARSRLPAVKESLSRYLQETAAAYAELNGKLGKHPLTHLLRQRLQTLLAAGFASHTPWAQWPRLPIYLKAMTLRLEKYSGNPACDAAREADIQELEQMWQEKTDGLVKQGLPVSDDLAAFKWMIEELRVSLFAQELKTPYPVSVKRLLKEWERLK
ncbi:ATP dependent DNA helicase [Neisseria elongata]|uniref:ATP dependent DNA helicase n=1 Tax=Neisseria elongata TaxID=495 RepID=A0A378TZA8_NEIEL|nr:GNAT family N-acetyltransferase [Neisseria elongata]SFH22629.1 Acetyltransferase (GNAT) family protein [Neisseria elongata subsp. elongata]STZ68247.1 ATP dependent DNA helicase [Neisseria elongata]